MKIYEISKKCECGRMISTFITEKNFFLNEQGKLFAFGDRTRKDGWIRILCECGKKHTADISMEINGKKEIQFESVSEKQKKYAEDLLQQAFEDYMLWKREANIEKLDEVDKEFFEEDKKRFEEASKLKTAKEIIDFLR